MAARTLWSRSSSITKWLSPPDAMIATRSQPLKVLNGALQCLAQRQAAMNLGLIERIVDVQNHRHAGRRSVAENGMIQEAVRVRNPVPRAALWESKTIAPDRNLRPRATSECDPPAPARRDKWRPLRGALPTSAMLSPGEFSCRCCTFLISSPRINGDRPASGLRRRTRADRCPRSRLLPGRSP